MLRENSYLIYYITKFRIICKYSSISFHLQNSYLLFQEKYPFTYWYIDTNIHTSTKTEQYQKSLYMASICYEQFSHPTDNHYTQILIIS